MKQKLEEAAMQELNSSYATIVDGELVYQRQAMLNMFKKGAEWQLEQSKWIPVKEQLPDASNFGVSDNVLLKVSIKNKKCKGIYNTYQCCIEAFYDSDIEQWCYLPPIDEKNIKITPVAWREINS